MYVAQRSLKVEPADGAQEGHAVSQYTDGGWCTTIQHKHAMLRKTSFPPLPSPPARTNNTAPSIRR